MSWRLPSNVCVFIPMSYLQSSRMRHLKIMPKTQLAIKHKRIVVMMRQQMTTTKTYHKTQKQDIIASEFLLTHLNFGPKRVKTLNKFSPHIPCLFLPYIIQFYRFGREFRLPENTELEEWSMFYIGSQSLCLTNLMMSYNKCQVSKKIIKRSCHHPRPIVIVCVMLWQL